MADADQELNPFQAPKFQSEPQQRLAPDQQFLISRRQIICREKVVLPRLCIHTGEVEKLVERKKILHAPATAPLVIFSVAICLIVVAMTIGFRGSSIASLIVASLIVGSVANLFWKLLPWSLLHTVDATWYISERYLRRVFWYRILTRTILSAIGGAVAAMLSSAAVTTDGSVIRLLLAIVVGSAAGFALSFTVQAERPLTLHGKRFTGPQKGLMVLQGHSRHFTENAQRIAAGGFSQ